MRRYLRTLLVAGLFSAIVPTSAYAQLTGTLGATLTLTTACTISGGTGTTGLDFGLLDFGTHPATFSGILTTHATGGASIAGDTEILCSPDVTAVQVTVDGGSHAGQGATIGAGSRALAAGTDYMPYEVYSSSGMTTAYPTNGSALSVTVASPGAPFALPIYGRINKTSTDAVAVGVYTDTLQVTLSW
jgi:spore coat protein U-like protein